MKPFGGMRFAGLLLSVLCLGARTGYAQQPRSDAYAAALRSMTESPADPEKAFAFSRVASAEGDLAGATAALERILLLNPRLDNIRLELGLLYQRAGNYVLAREYLQEALQAPDVPEAVRARGASALSQAEAGLSRHNVRGFVTAGARYETNANAGPSSGQVNFLGVPFELQSRDRKQDDFSIVGHASVNYTYDFDNQAGDYFEVNGVFSGAKYFEETDQDVFAFELTAGPWLNPFWDTDVPLSVRPYAAAAYINLEGDTYAGIVGGGLSLRYPISARLLARGTSEISYRDFDNTETRRINDEQTGWQYLAQADLTFILDPTTTLLVGARYVREDAREEWESNNSVGALVALSKRFTIAPLTDERFWAATLRGSIDYYGYDGADPRIDPRTRRETRYEIGLVNSIPLTDQLSLDLSASYTARESRIRNFDFDNAAFGVSFTYAF